MLAEMGTGAGERGRGELSGTILLADVEGGVNATPFFLSPASFL